MDASPNTGGEPGTIGLMCSCGRRSVELPRFGSCRLCYLSRYRSLHRFAGEREGVVERDRGRCRVCGTRSGLIVHHRSGETGPKILICRVCHPTLHRSLRLRSWVPGLLATLWAEVHPDSPCQLQFEFAPDERTHLSA